MFKIQNARTSAQKGRFEHSIIIHLKIVSDFGFQISDLFRHWSSVIGHFALAMSILSATSCKKMPTQTSRIDPRGPVEVVIPEHGAYAGAFMDFGDEEDDVTLEMIEDFERLVGKHQ